jgi:hypothetical protein
METTLAIYEALLQASVPPAAARRVAECLEKDMTTNLATKQDMLHLERQMNTRFDAMESRFVLTQQSLESRIVFKLGALMVVLFGLASALQRLAG